MSQCVRSTWPRASDLLTKLGVVVDLAVVDDDHRAILVNHRLRSTRHIQDREPSIAKAHPVTDEETLSVGPAMREDVGHRPDQVLVAEPCGSRDAAHERSGSLVRGHVTAANVDSK